MYALVDCNNFYASCERIANPSLNNRPVVILSNNDGCVIARSNEAKPYVPMGAVAFKYREVFEQQKIAVFSSNYALYGDLSHRVMNTLAMFTPDIEIYSIDEAFLKFNGFENYNFTEYGIQMRTRVLSWTKIPVSIGFAPTKALAKVANKIAKKFAVRTQGVYVIDTEEKRIKALKWTKVEDVWGIGRQLSKRLQAKGVTTAYEFTQLPNDYVSKEFSVVGLRLKQELEGISVLELDEVANKKSIATTRSFDRDIEAFEPLKERVSTFAVTCAEKLRKQGTAANIVTVFIHTNGFKEHNPQYMRNVSIKLPYASNSSITLSQYALMGLKAIYKKGFEYKKAGVIVSAIVPETNGQMNLFVAENPKHKTAMKAMDEINAKMGRKKLKLGSQDPGRTWKMRQEKLSQGFTTNLNEILEVS